MVAVLFAVLSLKHVVSPSRRLPSATQAASLRSIGVPQPGCLLLTLPWGGAEGLLWPQERRFKAEGQPGELGGEGPGKLGPCLDLHQSHSMPLPEGVSVTVDTVRAATVSKKGASPPAVFTVAADARDGMPPPQAITDSRALFMDVLGQADFDPGEAGTSPRHMVRAPAHAEGYLRAATNCQAATARVAARGCVRSSASTHSADGLLQEPEG